MYNYLTTFPSSSRLRRQWETQCLELVRLFSIHMDWRGLIRIVRDFDLLGIETLSIHMDWGRTEHGLKGHFPLWLVSHFRGQGYFKLLSKMCVLFRNACSSLSRRLFCQMSIL
jgi:hypothetical protein